MTTQPADFVTANTTIDRPALTRHVMDNAAIVAGRRVLDIATGSGLVAIAALLARWS